MYHLNRASITHELSCIRRKTRELRSIHPADNLQKVALLKKINALLKKQNELICLRMRLIAENFNQG